MTLMQLAGATGLNLMAFFASSNASLGLRFDPPVLPFVPFCPLLLFLDHPCVLFLDGQSRTTLHSVPVHWMHAGRRGGSCDAPWIFSRLIISFPVGLVLLRSLCRKPCSRFKASRVRVCTSCVPQWGQYVRASYPASCKYGGKCRVFVARGIETDCTTSDPSCYWQNPLQILRC